MKKRCAAKQPLFGSRRRAAEELIYLALIPFNYPNFT